MLVLSLVLTGVGIWAGDAIVLIMSNQLIEQMTGSLRREVDNMITFGQRMSTRMVNDIARRNIPLSDPVAIRRELYGLVSDEPNVQWLACGNDAGGMTDAGRLADGTIVFLMTDDFRAGVYRQYEASPDGRLGNLRKSGVYFDTREQPWYKRVRDTRARYWTEPYLGSVERLLGVGLSAPVFNKDGSFAGVCNVKLIFAALSDWLNSLRLGDNGRAFIIDAAGQLIAASGGVSPVAISADGKHSRLHALEAADPIVRETAGQLGRHPEIAEASSAGPRVFSFDDPERGRIYAAVDRFDAPDEIKWTIISALPASDFLGPVYRAAYLSIAVGTAIVAVFLLLGLSVVGRTLRPLAALTQAAQAIAKGEWREVPEVRRHDEVGLLAQAFARMTTRLKETLDGLRQSEAKLEEAQRVAHVGYWERDLDTDRITWSDETYRICGLTPGEGTITLSGALERVHPTDRRIWNQAVAGALRDASRYDLEFRVVRPHGEVRIVHSQGDLTRDASGRARSMFGTIQDITDRKRAEAALRASEERWRAMFETAPVGIATLNFERRTYLTANDSFQRMTGYAEDELRNFTTLDITEGDDWTATRKLIDDRAVGVLQQRRYRRKNGEIAWAEVNTFAVPATDSTPAFLGVVAVDITDRKRAEEALQQAQADLARLNRVMLLGEMTASIAHEVNQPIAATVTNAHAGLRWLSARPPDLEEAAQALGRIVRDGSRAGEVIDRIRAIVKKVPPRRELLDINEPIREVIALTQTDMQRNGIRLQTRLADDLPLVPADRVQLQQVIMNLLVNAIEAMSRIGDGSRELTIASGKDDASAVFVEVQDAGPGIDPADLDRLFQSFYTTKPDGIGMGLAISRSIVEAHGGRLSAASNQPHGALFRFTLLAEEKSSEGAPSHRASDMVSSIVVRQHGD
jgi:PAS domain S-box-containing protein